MVPRHILTFVLIGAFLAGISGCGFQPMYSKSANALTPSTSLKQVEVGTIANRQGQKLRNYLIDRMHRDGAETPHYRVIVSISTSKTDLGIRKDDTATRAQLRVTAPFQLVDLKTAEVLKAGTVRSVVEYNISDSQYSTLVNEQDAEDRGLNDVGDQIVHRISLYFSRSAQK